MDYILNMIWKNEGGSKKTLALGSVRTNLTNGIVHALMQLFIDKDFIVTNGGSLASIDNAYYKQTTTEALA